MSPRADLDENGRITCLYGTRLCHDCKAKDEDEAELREFRIREGEGFVYTSLCKSCAHKRKKMWFAGEGMWHIGTYFRGR